MADITKTSMTFNFILIFFPLATTAVSRLEMCGDEGKKVDDFMSCYSYLQCTEGMWIVKNCPTGTIFERDKGLCIKGITCQPKISQNHLTASNHDRGKKRKFYKTIEWSPFEESHELQSSYLFNDVSGEDFPVESIDSVGHDEQFNDRTAEFDESFENNGHSYDNQFNNSPLPFVPRPLGDSHKYAYEVQSSPLSLPYQVQKPFIPPIQQPYSSQRIDSYGQPQFPQAFQLRPQFQQAPLTFLQPQFPQAFQQFLQTQFQQSSKPYQPAHISQIVEQSQNLQPPTYYRPITNTDSESSVPDNFDESSEQLLSQSSDQPQQVFGENPSNETSEFVLPSNCGTLSQGVGGMANKVIGGKPVPIEDNPWQVALVAKFSKELSCGGSIISKKHVITAAHCFVHEGRILGKNLFLVYAGDANINNPDKAFRIRKLAVHEDYTDRTMANDIALITIDGEFEWSLQTYPVCLPEKDTNYRAGRDCKVTGWGKSDRADSEIFLHGITVKITTDDQCKYRNGKDNTITTGMFCAGDYIRGQVDACQGDSGGPLACEENGKGTLFGVTSWGIGCGRAEYPGVYTKVSKYIPWIKKTLADSMRKNYA